MRPNSRLSRSISGVHFARRASGIQRREVIGIAPAHLGGERLERAQALPHRDPQQQCEQRQGHQQRRQHAGNHARGKLGPQLAALAHVHEMLARGVPGGEHAPALAVDGAVAEALLAPTEGNIGCVLRVQAQPLAILPDLEGHAPRFLVQQRRMLGLDFLDVLGQLHDQQGRGLREMRVHHLVDLMARVDPGHRDGRHPDQRGGAQGERQQAPTQRCPHAAASRGIM